MGKKENIQKKKILWISDFDGTGYAMASITIINGMIANNVEEKYDIHYMVINSLKTFDYHKNNLSKLITNFKESNLIVSEKNMSICNQNTESEVIKKLVYHQLYGINKLEQILETVKPEIVFMINDNNFLNMVFSVIKKYRPECKTVGYMPIDCENFGKNFFAKENKVIDQMITFNEFSRKEIKKTGYSGDIKILHHPVDSSFYYPLDKYEARKKIFNETLEDTFIILNYNNNQSRKRLDLTVEAFAIFMNRNPEVNARLVLKTKKDAMNDKGKNIMEIIKEMQNKYYPFLESKIKFVDKFLTTEEINYLYNACDVSLTTTSGEGWGLIPCEISLCGKPQIIPNNTSHPEIFEKTIKLIRTQEESWQSARRFQEDNPNRVMFCIQGLRDIINPSFIEQNGFKPNDFSFNWKILVAPTINNPECKIGEVKIGMNKFNTGFNKLKMLNTFINKYKPESFTVYCYAGNHSEFIADQFENFEFDKKVLDEYKIECVVKRDVIANRDNYKNKVRIPLVDDIADTIELYYKNPNKGIEDGIKCQERIKYFNKERIGNELIQIFDSI